MEIYCILKAHLIELLSQKWFVLNTYYKVFSGVSILVGAGSQPSSLDTQYTAQFFNAHCWV